MREDSALPKPFEETKTGPQQKKPAWEAGLNCSALLG